MRVTRTKWAEASRKRRFQEPRTATCKSRPKEFSPVLILLCLSVSGNFMPCATCQKGFQAGARHGRVVAISVVQVVFHFFHPCSVQQFTSLSGIAIQPWSFIRSTPNPRRHPQVPALVKLCCLAFEIRLKKFRALYLMTALKGGLLAACPADFSRSASLPSYFLYRGSSARPVGCRGFFMVHSRS